MNVRRALDPWLLGAHEAQLEAHGLSHRYFVGHGGLRRKGVVQALRDVSLFVDAGETLAVVGESGSGKSTLARALLRLVQPDAGQLLWRTRAGEVLDLMRLRGARLLQVRRELGVVFQDPFASLNPRLTIGATLREPLEVLAGMARAAAEARAQALLERVGLEADLARRHPHQLSGGQRQRVALARALALEPRLLVCDEVVSALDVSVQAQVLDLLDELQASMGLAIVFITHDFSVVRHVADRVAVLDAGRMVEVGKREEILESPAHATTRALLEAEPRLPGVVGPSAQRKQRGAKATRGQDVHACAEGAVRLSPTHVVLAAPPGA